MHHMYLCLLGYFDGKYSLWPNKAVLIMNFVRTRYGFDLIGHAKLYIQAFIRLASLYDRLCAKFSGSSDGKRSTLPMDMSYYVTS